MLALGVALATPSLSLVHERLLGASLVQQLVRFANLAARALRALSTRIAREQDASEHEP